MSQRSSANNLILYIARSCDEDNIDTEGVTIDPNLNTSINIGLVTEDGERTFITNRNGSLWKENIEHVNFDKIKEAKILSLASIFNCPLLDGKTLEKIFSFEKEHGMTITADMIVTFPVRPFPASSDQSQR